MISRLKVFFTFSFLFFIFFFELVLDELSSISTNGWLLTHCLFEQSACGVEYTSKLQRMFTDMTISADLNTGFKEWLQGTNMSNGGNEIVIKPFYMKRLPYNDN